MRTALSASAIVTLSLLAAPAFAAEWQPSAEGQVSVDATVYHDAKPDQVNLSVSCSTNTPASKTVLREDFAKTLKAIADIVGSNGAIRRSGVPSFYSYYGDMGRTDEYTGQMDFTLVGLKGEAQVNVIDRLPEFGCSGNWDIRVNSATSYARQHKTELLAQINDKKALYEELLGISLTRVSNISVYTSTDGYNTFDPETGLIRAMTTMSVTFDMGMGAKAK